MKKYFFNAACLCLCAGFALMGCKKDDDDSPGSSSVDNTYTVKVESGSSYNSKIDNVKAFIDENYEIASGSYANGEFKLDLPETVSSSRLESIAEDMPETVTISNKNAKIGVADYIAGYKSGIQVGSFSYSNYSPDKEVDSGCDANLVYVDSDVTVTGSDSGKYGEYTYSVSVNVSFKKGWNILYMNFSYSSSAETVTVTTKDPGGMKWYFYDYSDSKSYQSASVSKSKFSGMFKALK